MKVIQMRKKLFLTMDEEVIRMLKKKCSNVSRYLENLALKELASERTYGIQSFSRFGGSNPLPHIFFIKIFIL